MTTVCRVALRGLLSLVCAVVLVVLAVVPAGASRGSGSDHTARRPPARVGHTTATPSRHAPKMRPVRRSADHAKPSRRAAHRATGAHRPKGHARGHRAPAADPPPTSPAPSHAAVGPAPVRRAVVATAEPFRPVRVVFDPPMASAPPATTAPSPAPPPRRAVLERAFQVIKEPHLPSVPATRDPALPLLLIVTMAGCAAVLGRGDRRDPKLSRSSIDPGSRGIGFS